jgi:hypothetical protein
MSRTRKGKIVRYQRNKIFDCLDKHTIIVEFFDEIRWGWIFVRYTCFNGLIMGLGNLWDWLPVIWKDRHWDHSHTYTILEKKLRIQAEYFEKRDHQLNTDHDVKKMQVCAELLKRINEKIYLFVNPWNIKAEKRFGRLKHHHFGDGANSG